MSESSPLPTRKATTSWHSTRGSGPGNFAKTNIHRIETELGPQESAYRYQQEIKRHFHPSDGEMPRFDVIHRGMGPDGHTASLFPGEPLIGDHNGLAAPVWVQKMNQWCVNVATRSAGGRPRNSVMLVTGQDKSSMLQQIFADEYRPSDYPVQIAARDSNAEWFLDQAAAAELTE